MSLLVITALDPQMSKLGSDRNRFLNAVTVIVQRQKSDGNVDANQNVTFIFYIGVEVLSKLLRHRYVPFCDDM